MNLARRIDNKLGTMPKKMTNFLGREINFRCPALDFLSQAGPPHGAPMFGCNLEVSGFILTHNMIAWYRGPKTLDALPLIL